MPLFANGESRRASDMPLTTTASASVVAGTIQPPGHMQNENTPRSSTVAASRYAAAGNGYRAASAPYCARSISGCGCSTRTPSAKALASSPSPARVGEP